VRYRIAEEKRLPWHPEPMEKKRDPNLKIPAGKDFRSALPEASPEPAKAPNTSATESAGDPESDARSRINGIATGEAGTSIVLAVTSAKANPRSEFAVQTSPTKKNLSTAVYNPSASTGHTQNPFQNPKPDQLPIPAESPKQGSRAAHKNLGLDHKRGPLKEENRRPARRQPQKNDLARKKPSPDLTPEAIGLSAARKPKNFRNSPTMHRQPQPSRPSRNQIPPLRPPSAKTAATKKRPDLLQPLQPIKNPN
jgi:hypothetical protein